MRGVRTAAFVALALVLPGASAARADMPKPWHLSPGAYGPVRIGMTMGQVLGQLRTPLSIDGPHGPGCMGMSDPDLPSIRFIFEHDHLSRIAVVRGQDVAISGGLHIGSTEGEVRQKYGRRLIAAGAAEPPPAKTLTFWIPGKRSGIRFDIDVSGHVAAMIAGAPSIAHGASCP